MRYLQLNELAYLTTLYTQPHRHYHNLNHIHACLGELEQAEQDNALYLVHPDDVVIKPLTLAIWYHDAVYNPFSKENEHNSRMVFEDFNFHKRKDHVFSTNDYGLVVCDAIEFTARHHLDQEIKPSWSNSNTDEYVIKYMLDIDLAGFGKDYNNCREVADQIRQEYAHVSDKVFYTNRLNFFTALNKRKSIYYTKYFSNKYEKMARRNIKLELNELQSILRKNWKN